MWLKVVKKCMYIYIDCGHTENSQTDKQSDYNNLALQY